MLRLLSGALRKGLPATPSLGIVCSLAAPPHPRPAPPASPVSHLLALRRKGRDESCQ